MGTPVDWLYSTTTAAPLQKLWNPCCSTNSLVGLIMYVVDDCSTACIVQDQLSCSRNKLIRNIDSVTVSASPLLPAQLRTPSSSPLISLVRLTVSRYLSHSQNSRYFLLSAQECSPNCCHYCFSYTNIANALCDVLSATAGMRDDCLPEDKFAMFIRFSFIRAVLTVKMLSSTELINVS